MRGDFYQQLMIDEEFHRLEQPAEGGARQILEQELLQKGCKNAISLWGNIILEGFFRYQFCIKHELPVCTRQIQVHNRREALAWACAAQLKREDLKREMWIYLIGKRYSVEKDVPGYWFSQLPELHEQITDEKETGRRPVVRKTANRLGEEYGLGRCSITRYKAYAEAVDRIFQTAPQFAALILSGALEITQKDVVRLCRLPEQILRQAEEDPEKFAIQNRLLGKKRGRPPTYGLRLPDSALSNQMLVKQMPSYDPDAEISGLTLTIPSWISSIQRTRAAAEFSAISANALERLTEQLSCLEQSIEKLMSAVKEVS